MRPVSPSVIQRSRSTIQISAAPPATVMSGTASALVVDGTCRLTACGMRDQSASPKAGASIPSSLGELVSRSIFPRGYPMPPTRRTPVLQALAILISPMRRSLLPSKCITPGRFEPSTCSPTTRLPIPNIRTNSCVRSHITWSRAISSLIPTASPTCRLRTALTSIQSTETVSPHHNPTCAFPRSIRSTIPLIERTACRATFCAAPV